LLGRSLKSWKNFATHNASILNFAFWFNLFSAFGQTYFISLFVPAWVASFGISNATFGSSYALVTLGAALMLSLTGGFLDRMSLRRYGSLVYTGLMLAVVVLAHAQNFGALLLGLFMVRWFGQGLMTHTSSTGIARHFEGGRGKALGLTSLGHPAGQFFLPLLMTPWLIMWGWRNSILVLAMASVLILIPTLFQLKNAQSAPIQDPHSKKSAPPLPAWTLIKKWDFWMIAANVFAMPLICTAVFLYQYTLGIRYGWEQSWITYSFSYFAIFSALALIASGPLVDRFSGTKLFPFYLLPGMLGLLIFAFMPLKAFLPVCYALLGVSTGMGSTVKTAMQVEYYGKSQIGQIRSYFSTLLVFSTAVGPPLFGYFLDKQIPFATLFGVSGFWVLLVILLSTRIKPSRPL
jgi:MFS family permease